MMKLVYVSGPMSADTRWETEVASQRLIKAGLDLIRTGHAVIIPAWLGDHINRNELTAGLNNRNNGKKWKLEDQILDSDCECVRRSDAIMLCKGWSKSKGALQERDAAIEAGIEIMYGEGAERYVDTTTEG